MAEPGDDKEESCCYHEHGSDLSPKTAWEFVLDRGFLGVPTCSRFSFSRFTFFRSHICYIAQTIDKRKGLGIFGAEDGPEGLFTSPLMVSALLSSLGESLSVQFFHGLIVFVFFAIHLAAKVLHGFLIFTAFV